MNPDKMLELIMDLKEFEERFADEPGPAKIARIMRQGLESAYILSTVR
jgi:hypothetical protein